jgi:hypothetical protein
MIYLYDRNAYLRPTPPATLLAALVGRTLLRLDLQAAINRFVAETNRQTMIPSRSHGPQTQTKTSPLSDEVKC